MSNEMPLVSGVHRELEEAANALIKTSLAKTTRHSDKSDILTPWKENDRRKREVYVSGGVPDAQLRQGDFRRSANVERPHLNSMEGCTPPRAARQTINPWDMQ